MKRRILSTLLVGILMLYGCGNSAASGGSQSGTSASDDVIEFNPAYVAIDDENVRMEITSVSKEVRNAGTKGESYEYRVNFTLTNKSDVYGAGVGISSNDGSIGSYTVVFSTGGGDVRPGKISDGAHFTVNSESEHVTSVEDLLDFNALVRVEVFEDTGSSRTIRDSYKVEVSLKDAQHK